MSGKAIGAQQATAIGKKWSTSLSAFGKEKNRCARAKMANGQFKLLKALSDPTRRVCLSPCPFHEAVLKANAESKGGDGFGVQKGRCLSQ